MDMEKIVEEQKRKEQLTKDVMEEMVKRGFTVGESEKFPEKLAYALQRNSERFAKEKPFAIFQYKD